MTSATAHIACKRTLTTSEPVTAYAPVANNYGSVFEASSLLPLPTDLRFTRGSQQLIIPGIFTAATKPGDIQTSYQFGSDRGLQNTLTDPTLKLTMFAPINEAFSTPFPQGSLVASANVSDLLLATPSSRDPIIGYSIVPTAFPSSALTPGRLLNTTNTVKASQTSLSGANIPLQLQVIPGASGGIGLEGVGSTADVIQADVPTCGPSVIHVINAVLLPFSPNDAGLTPNTVQAAASLTTTPSAPISSFTSLPAPGGR
ncbi:hypothetical protein WJX72_004480 [[Myrmecia] bisecta]|uniref:FAS1 domain-containing protein n=1 Tax=[Myrmecia] bisecta TaxID=41462 RepID=A0AAW1PCL2_9CHLO